MKTEIIHFRLPAIYVIGLLVSFPASGYSQSMTLARRVVRFDGKPAAGAKVILPEDDAMWQRGASNAGYHYLGCAKTMALIGRAFAEAVLEMEKN